MTIDRRNIFAILTIAVFVLIINELTNVFAIVYGFLSAIHWYELFVVGINHPITIVMLLGVWAVLIYMIYIYARSEDGDEE